MSDIFEGTEGISSFVNADSMIRANGEAEALETQKLKETADRYSQQIEELKQLYEKNNTLIDELKAMTESNAAKIEEVVNKAADKIEENNASIKDIDLSQINTALETTLTNELSASAEKTAEKTAELIQQSDDFSHKENVRVYRNIQAATEQLLKKQSEQLVEEIESLKKPVKRKPQGIQIAILIFVILTFAVELCDCLGVIDILLHSIAG